MRYFEVTPAEQRGRLVQRQAEAPQTTWPISDEELAQWAGNIDIPTAGELDGSEPIHDPPHRFATWEEWHRHPGRRRSARQHGDLVRRQLEVVDGQKLLNFRDRHRQLGRSDLGQVSWIRYRWSDIMGSFRVVMPADWGRMPRHHVLGSDDLRVAEHMHVNEDQDQVFIRLARSVGQLVDRVLGQRAIRVRSGVVGHQRDCREGCISYRSGRRAPAFFTLATTAST